jgi:hypothetical protein
MFVSPSLRLSVGMEKLVSHWMEFHKIWYMSSFFFFFEKLSKNYYNPTIIMSTLHEDFLLLWLYLVEFFLEWESFQINLSQKLKHAFYVQEIFFSKNCAVFEVMSRNWGGGSQRGSGQYGACALRAYKYCFSEKETSIISCSVSEYCCFANFVPEKFHRWKYFIIVSAERTNGKRRLNIVSNKCYVIVHLLAGRGLWYDGRIYQLHPFNFTAHEMLMVSVTFVAS